jgi:predicted HTH domain antitoxin
MLSGWGCGVHCLPSLDSYQQRVRISLLLLCVQGRPVYIQLLGKIDINTLKQITTEERMIKFHIQEYERCGKVIMPICSRLAGRQIDQTFGIMDVKGGHAAWC